MSTPQSSINDNASCEADSVASVSSSGKKRFLVNDLTPNSKRIYLEEQRKKKADRSKAWRETKKKSHVDGHVAQSTSSPTRNLIHDLNRDQNSNAVDEPAGRIRWERKTDGVRFVHLLLSPPAEMVGLLEKMFSKSTWQQLTLRQSNKQEYFTKAAAVFNDCNWSPQLGIQDAFLMDMGATPSVANSAVTPLLLSKRFSELKSDINDVLRRRKSGDNHNDLYELCIVCRRYCSHSVYGVHAT